MSSVEIVSGGAIRSTRPEAGELDDVHVQAQLEAALGHRDAVGRVGLARLAVRDEVDAEHEADAADVADRLVAALELLEPRAQARAHGDRASAQVLGQHRPHDGAPDGGGERVRDVRGDVQEALLERVGLDRVGGDRRRQRQAAAERLRQRDEVRHHVVLLEREHRPDAAERRLRLVDDEQHPALLAALLERREVAVGQRHDAARAEDRLDDRGGGRADRLRVGHREAGVEAGQVAAVAAVGDRAAVRVRRRQRHRAGERRAVAAAAGAVGARRGAGGHAVPRAREGEHLVAAGVELGEPQRGLVRLAAGGQEHRARRAARAAAPSARARAR